MEENEISKDNYDKTRLAIARSLSYLMKKENKVFRHLDKGRKPEYYALTSWQDQNGNLKKEYEMKIKK